MKLTKRKINLAGKYSILSADKNNVLYLGRALKATCLYKLANGTEVHQRPIACNWGGLPKLVLKYVGELNGVFEASLLDSG